MLPGALMYRRPVDPKCGVPDTYSLRSAHVHAAEEAPVFSAMAEFERKALFGSLARTVRRSIFHEKRYAMLRLELDRRRNELPGEVSFDEFVEALHFELQAFCGATRMVLDELVYIIARRHGVATGKARRKPWETSFLLKPTETPPPDCLVEEIVYLRGEHVWFSLLNAYRNTFFHHGWSHAAGHFDASDGRSAARAAKTNGLLVPDLASLAGRSKPNEWTHTEGRTVDDIYRDVRIGFERVLQEIFQTLWSTPEPTPGTMPREEQPNIIVRLPSPRVVTLGNLVFVPIFSEPVGAAGLPPFDERVENELVEVPVVSSVVGQRAVSFSLRGFEPEHVPAGATTFDVLIDPQIIDEKNIQCRGRVRYELAPYLTSKFPHVDVIIKNAKSVFMWQRRSESKGGRR